jgi:quinol monooxygenase YgiN
VTKRHEPYTSGDWLVKEGNEQAFIDQWVAVAGWCLEHSAGARSFRLIRDRANPRHFISFGEWDDFASVGVARSRPGFLELFRGCQDLCERFSGSDYTVALAVPES